MGNLQYWQGNDGDWYWHLRDGGNNYIIADGAEGYSSERKVKDAIENVKEEVQSLEGPEHIEDTVENHDKDIVEQSVSERPEDDRGPKEEDL